MYRISRHMMFMQMAEAASRRSTCYRRSVGAILVHHANFRANVISIGYNGPPSGEPHCTGSNCPSAAGCTRAVHAEVNVLQALDPTRRPLSLYVTESPCLECAQLITHHPIRDVFFFHEYRIRDGISCLLRNSIKVFRMTPGGYMIDYSTNELVEE